jgi:putative PIN family toxin of toxin-antitoxin system
VIRATLDVNVLISAFPATQGTLAELMARWATVQFELIVSEVILAELATVWQRPYWRTRYTADAVQSILKRLQAQAIFVEPDFNVRGVCEDEEDDLVLATAAAGHAGFLVTGDKFPQALGGYENVTILSPRQFLDLLEEAAAPTI